MPSLHPKFLIAATCVVAIQVGAQISLPLPAEIDAADAEYSAAGAKLSSDYQTDRARCDGMSGNAKSVCIQEAKGKEGVAKAEADQRRRPSDSNARRVSEAKVQAAYDVAMQKCDDQRDAERTRCVARANAEQAKGMAGIKPLKN